MENTRTINVARNVTFALITQSLNLILSFVSRTIFIRVLSIEYLGINGLFSNILVLLSFAELGIGEAIIYSMYKPLAENNVEKIKSLMKLYSIAYKTIGLVVLVSGLLVVPFLGYIINEEPNISESINFIYILFLLNTASSYFYTYKKSIIIADQKKYLVSIYQQVFHMIQVIAQISFLLYTENYIVFLLVQIVFTFLNNYAISIRANRMYPYLKDTTIKELERKEKTNIITNIKAMFMYKIGDVILGGSDNVIISATIGVASVGLVSNYQIIIIAFTTIYRQIIGSFTASVGNLNAIDKSDNKLFVFERMFYLSTWIVGFFTVGMMILINPLISIWLGDEFLLSNNVVIAVSVYFYIKNTHITALTFRTTMGFFRQGRYAPLAAAILNVILSIFLGINFGLTGIFIASSIASFVTVGIVDPILVYKNGFKKSPLIYYKKYFSYTFIAIFIYIIMTKAINILPPTSINSFILNILIVFICYNTIFIVLTFRTKEFKNLSETLIMVLFKK